VRDKPLSGYKCTTSGPSLFSLLLLSLPLSIDGLPEGEGKHQEDIPAATLSKKESKKFRIH
jgi:hypothetical protein